MNQSVRLRSIDCLTIIEQRLPALTGASRRVAEMIVRDPWAILGMTIYDVAAASGVSLPSVTRFCRAVGYPGFRDLVQGVAQSLGRTDPRDVDALKSAPDGTGLAALATRIVNRQVDALQTTLRTFDFEAIERAVAAIARAQRVIVVGHGGAYVSVLGIAVKLNWAGVPAFPATPDLFSNQILAVGKDDVIIGVSHQGRTRDTIEMLRLARSFEATTIGVAIVAQSPLTEVADISIAVLSPDVVQAGTFLIAYNAVMVLADLLTAAVAERRWNGPPPNQERVVEWIETNLRVGPTLETGHRPRRTRPRVKRQQPSEGTTSIG